MIALGVVGIAIWLLPQFKKTAPALAPPPLSIAILPFAAPAGSPADEQFADAVTRDLMTVLGRWRIAKVASLGLAASYKGKLFDPRSIGRELSVLYLVEGDVGSAGDKVTVNTRLVDARRLLLRDCGHYSRPPGSACIAPADPGRSVGGS